ncbi:MAG: phage holin family protein [Pseudomonadota bacterium]
MTEQPKTGRTTPGLVSDVLDHISNLVRKEVDLARAELSSNLSRAGVAIGLLVGAVVIALVSLNVLAGALVAAIAELGIEPAWSALIVGGLLALAAFALVSKGLHDLKLSSLAPTRTVENVRRDAEAVKEVL